MSWTLETVRPVLDKLKYFELDHEKISQVAEIMKPDVKAIDRSWNWPPHDVEKPGDKWPLLAVQNILNYMGWKKYGGEKRTFTIEHGGKRHYGAGAIMACIKRAYDDGVPVLNPAYLKKLNVSDAKKIFEGEREVAGENGATRYVDMVVPAFFERVNFLKNLGKTVSGLGGFEEVVEQAGGYAFREDGSGLVQLLAKADGYNDVTIHEPTNSRLEFYKKAQLAVIMGFESGAIPKIKDRNRLSVAADYMLPAFGIYTGMMKVTDDGLLKALQSDGIIKSGSVPEQEMRSCTVAMGAELAKLTGNSEYMVDYPMFGQATKKCRKIGTKDSVCATGCAYNGVCNAMSDPEVAKIGLPRVVGSFY